MKLSNRVKKILNHLEVQDHKAWIGSHSQAIEFVLLLLKEEEESTIKEVYKEIDYESPNWQYIQADRAGVLRTINKLKHILED